MFDGWGGETGVITEVSTGNDPNQTYEGGRRSGSSEGTESTRNLTERQGKGAVLKTVDVTVEVEEHYRQDRL